MILANIILVTLILSCSAIVSPIFPGEEHYPGYINIEGDYNLFYWFFKSRTRDPNAPFVFWIQGGPGCAGTSSVLDETGPFDINEDLTLSQRQYSINNFADVLYIDQPLGTGFSNCSNKDRIPRTEAGVVKDVLTFYRKFLEKFPHNKEIYLVGQSYAGHYVPAIAKHFIENGIKVKGGAISNGWYHPDIQIRQRGVYTRKHNLAPEINLVLGRIFEEVEIFFSHMGWYDAADKAESMVAGFYQGFEHKRFNLYDIRLPCPDEFIESECYNDTLLVGLMERKDVREILGVGNRSFEDCGEEIPKIMLEDNYMDISDIVIELLDKYDFKLLLYSGQYDWVCDIEGQKAWVEQLGWKYKKELNAEGWKDWYVDGDNVGEYKTYKNLWHAIVYEAGHMVVSDTPSVMVDAIYRLIYQF